MRSEYNLHIHSDFSDGRDSVASIVARLVAEGVRTFAITDHDTVTGQALARREAAVAGLAWLSGVELSCCFGGEVGIDVTHQCHIIGLGFDIQRMNAELMRVRMGKHRMVQALLSALIADGYLIAPMRNLVQFGRINDRAIVADVLVACGYATNRADAFERILNSQRYINFAWTAPSIKQGIQLIHNAGGRAVWAHPFGVSRGGREHLSYKKLDTLASQMWAYGLDGIECYYQAYDRDDTEHLVELADRYDWLRSVGTDYHHSLGGQLYYDAYQPAECTITRPKVGD